MKKNVILKRIAYALLILLILLFLFLPLPYYVEGPGSADDLNQFVRVDNKKDTAKGNYMLVTVGVQGPVTPVRYLLAKTQPFYDVVSKQELMGNETGSTYEKIQNYYMQSSINDAIETAYKAADKKVTREYLGIYVWSIMNNSNFKGVLKVGDTVTEIDGHKFDSSKKFINYVKSKPVGTKVTITYQHKGKTKQATRKLVKLAGTKRAGLGITLTDHTKVKTDIPVSINAGSIGGPSAGTMFALEIYSQLTNTENLRHGKNIAGTGTISDQGEVGQIGGIDKKVVAANRKHATVFFAPDQPATKAIKKIDPNYVNNYTEAKQTAKRLHTKMKIVPIKKFDDVLNYLKTH